MKKTICTSLFLLACILLNAQDKFYLRSDIGIDHAIVSSGTSGITADFKSREAILSNVDPVWGLYLGGSVYKNLNLELGFKIQSYSDRYTAMLGEYGISGLSGGSKTFIIVPLNLSYKYQIAKSKFSVIPHLGVSFINSLEKYNFKTGITFDNMESAGNVGTINNTFKYTTFNAEPANDFSFLLNAGIGAEYRIHKRWGITLDGNYSLGFKELSRYDLLLKNENTNLKGELSYKGSQYSVACGVKFYF